MAGNFNLGPEGRGRRDVMSAGFAALVAVAGDHRSYFAANFIGDGPAEAAAGMSHGFSPFVLPNAARLLQ
ncbi:MAG: hypothetical protein ABJ327_02135 [Litoreibacter sp.]